MRPVIEQPHHILALADTQLHYTQSGNGNDTILLIHGSLCDYRYWRWQIPALAEQHHVLAPSLRGCWPTAQSHPQSGYSIHTHAQDLVHLVRALDKQTGVHILGHSRGAQVAMEFVSLAPDLCRSLILADPGFRFDDEPETTPFYTSSIAQLEAGDIDGALERFIDTVNGEDTWRRMVSWFKDMTRDNALTLLSQVLEANTPVTRQAVAELTCPLLLLGGTNSPAKYGSRQDRLQEMVPRARREHIALAAHGMNIANPRAFNQTVLDFVESTWGQAA